MQASSTVSFLFLPNHPCHTDTYPK